MNIRRITRRSMLATAAAGTLTRVIQPRRAAAQTVRTLKVIAFPGGGSGLLILIAQRQGFFAREGIAVQVSGTPGSVYQMTHLISGDFDIAHTAADNVVAYSEGQGEVQIAGDTAVVAVMGGDNGFLHVLARPQYTRYADLRGKRLGVEALATGYSFVLRKLLALNGLGPADYELVGAGAGARRFQELVEGQLDGTISGTPSDVLAEAAGLRVFGPAIEALGHYQGAVCATRRAWATANRDALRAYIRAYVRALDWLYDPARKDDVMAILLQNNRLSPALAAKVYGIMIDRTSGYDPRAAIDLAGMQTVINLRQEFGPNKTPLGLPRDYVDLRAYRRALE